LALEWLLLRTNRIGEKGASHLAEGLKLSRSLHTLLLGHNDIKDAGATAVAGAIRDGCQLTTLDIGGNDITDQGLEPICEVLLDNCRLKKLILRINRLGNNGVQILSDSLLRNTHLTELDLGGNVIRDESIQALKDLVGYNQSLHTLNLEQINLLHRAVVIFIVLLILPHAQNITSGSRWSQHSHKDAIGFSQSLEQLQWSLASMFQHFLDCETSFMSVTGDTALVISMFLLGWAVISRMSARRDSQLGKGRPTVATNPVVEE